MSTLDIVVGGQFGSLSEAKGHVTKRVLARNIEQTPESRHHNIRVAGPNAGHCVLDENGRKFALRAIPVGAVLDGVYLIIAPGSEVDPEVLEDEWVTLEEAGHRLEGRLMVHEEATVLTPAHREAEAGMQERMGSTGKGIGACRADRIMRTATRVGDDSEVVSMIESKGGQVISGSLDFLTRDRVVIEGTQGYGLGMHAGHYPQCTSSDCRAIDFAAMAGLNPWDFDEFTPWVVARVYPIRVAGNSGPMLGESSWEDLGLPPEYTTVTKKVRRVGEWDPELIRAALTANGRKSVIALTMLDQKFDSVEGKDWINAEALGYISRLDGIEGHRVGLVTTGEDTGAWL